MISVLGKAPQQCHYKKVVMSPISTTTVQSKLPFLAKVLESFVSLQLHAFIDSLNILQPRQAGFCPGHSTITAAVSDIDNTGSSLDEKQFCAVLSRKHLIPSIIKSYSTNYSLQVQMQPLFRLLVPMVLNHTILPSEMGCYRGLSWVHCCLHYT